MGSLCLLLSPPAAECRCCCGSDTLEDNIDQHLLQSTVHFLTARRMLQDSRWRAGRQRLMRRLNEVVVRVHNGSLHTYAVSNIA